jgi:PhoH-like ATPase
MEHLKDFTQIAVLDTNVLVDDFRATLKFPNTLVVIPRVVIGELDGLKNSKDGNKRAVVRKASNLIDQITEEFEDEEIEVMPLETEGSYLVIEGNYQHEFDTVEPDKPDNRIISVAVAYATMNPEAKITLYSNDTDVRIEARSVKRMLKLYNLRAKKYKMIDTGLDEINTGVVNLLQPTKVLLETRKNQKFDIELPYVNGEHVFMVDEMNFDHQVLATYNSVHKRLETIHDWKIGESVWGAGDGAVRPRDARQNFLMNDIMDKTKYINFILSRVAGAGKNYITTACILNLLKEEEYDRYILIKPMVEIGDQLGLLPGTKEEKMGPWFESFKDTMFELTNDGFELPAELEGKIELDVVTHMRGRSIPRTIIHLDECQNYSVEAVKTMLTRAGEDTKIILSGDLSQIDNPRLDSENNGLRVWAERARHKDYGFEHSTYILLESNFRSELSAWASSFYE